MWNSYWFWIMINSTLLHPAARVEPVSPKECLPSIKCLWPKEYHKKNRDHQIILFALRKPPCKYWHITSHCADHECINNTSGCLEALNNQWVIFTLFGQSFTLSNQKDNQMQKNEKELYRAPMQRKKLCNNKKRQTNAILCSEELGLEMLKSAFHLSYQISLIVL